MARILVVEDEPGLRDLIRSALQLGRHTVETACDGCAGLDAVARELPDLILLDLAMPGMDGWRFLDEVYARGLRGRTRVVIVTGYWDPDAAASRARAPVRHVLTKPFDASTLLGVVNHVLQEDPAELARAARGNRSLSRLIEDLDRVLGQS